MAASSGGLRAGPTGRAHRTTIGGEHRASHARWTLRGAPGRGRVLTGSSQQRSLWLEKDEAVFPQARKRGQQRVEEAPMDAPVEPTVDGADDVPTWEEIVEQHSDRV